LNEDKRLKHGEVVFKTVGQKVADKVAASLAEAEIYNPFKIFILDSDTLHFLNKGFDP
jgi:hypothetical protein